MKQAWPPITGPTNTCPDEMNPASKKLMRTSDRWTFKMILFTGVDISDLIENEPYFLYLHFISRQRKNKSSL